MVAQLVLIQEAEGVLRDWDGHLHNIAGQKIDDQGAVILDPEAAAADFIDGENPGANAEDATAGNV